jgi:hypothetical protein
MTRRALAALILLGLAAVPAVSLAGCATKSAQSGQTTTSRPGDGAARPLSVSPSAGGPTTTFSLRFTAPASAGVTGNSRLGYTLSLIGPRQVGRCIGVRSEPVPAATKGVPLPITLDPAHLGGSWCTGAYTARVVELVGPACAPGTVCPQFVRVVGTVGTATFRVQASS